VAQVSPRGHSHERHIRDHARQGRIGSLTAPVEAVDFDAAVARQLTAEYNQHCPMRGLSPVGDIHFDVQANWITDGLDVTATAYVCAVRGSKRRAPGRARTRRAAA
jgi:hypothetical protein